MSKKERHNRAQQYMALALTPPLGLGFETPTPIAASILRDEVFKIYYLLREEEELAPRLQQDHQTFTRAEIERVVTLVKELAAAGYSTNLVETDEMLDIYQIFNKKSPVVSKIFQQINHIYAELSLSAQKSGNPVRKVVAARQRTECAALEIPQKPSQSDASVILAKIISDLQEKGNTAWTVRVIAALAYFSTLPNPD